MFGTPPVGGLLKGRQNVDLSPLPGLFLARISTGGSLRFTPGYDLSALRACCFSCVAGPSANSMWHSTSRRQRA